MAFQPDARSLHADSYLTNISIGYQNTEYIADSIFPTMPVNKQSDLIPTYDQSPWFRDEAQLRGPGTKSQRSGWTTGSSTYYCPRWSFAHEIPDEVRDNADAPWNLDLESTEYVTDKLQMRRERSFAAAFFTNTSVWGTDKVGTSDFVKYSDYGGSNPLVDFTTYQDLIESGIGRMPNTLVMGKLAWSTIKWHPDLIDTIKYTQKGVIGPDVFAGLIEVPRFLIGRSIYTASVEGTAEASVTYSRIWGNHALLAYVAPAPSLMTPSAGYTFVWQRVPGAQQYMKRIRDEEREVDIIEGNSYFDQQQTAKKAGLFMQSVI